VRRMILSKLSAVDESPTARPFAVSSGIYGEQAWRVGFRMARGIGEGGWVEMVKCYE